MYKNIKFLTALLLSSVPVFGKTVTITNNSKHLIGELRLGVLQFGTNARLIRKDLIGTEEPYKAYAILENVKPGESRSVEIPDNAGVYKFLARVPCGIKVGNKVLEVASIYASKKVDYVKETNFTIEDRSSSNGSQDFAFCSGN